MTAAYVVRWRYTPTDFSYFTDDPDAPYSEDITEVGCDTLEEACGILAWYPGGMVFRADGSRVNDASIRCAEEVEA